MFFFIVNINKILIKINRNVVKRQLNSVAKFINFEQLVLRAIVILIIMHKTTYNINNKFIVKLVKILQLKNKFFIKIKVDKTINKRKDIKA